MPPRDHRLSLGASIGLALAAAVIIGTGTAVIMYKADSIWFYAYILVGIGIGSAVNYRARPATWRTRSYLPSRICATTACWARAKPSRSSSRAPAPSGW
jgi:hypothetical protein